MDNLHEQIHIPDEALESFSDQVVNEVLDQKLRDRYKELLARDHGLVRKSEKDSGPYKIILISLAVLILSIVAFCLFFMSNTKEVQIAEYINQTHILGNQDLLRKGKIDENQIRISANNSFIQGKYETAINQYEQLVALEKSTPTDYFYLGTSYLKKASPDLDEAIHNLEVTRTRTNIWNQETNWLLALAHLLQNNEEKAFPLLQDITKRRSYKWKEAEILLRQLSKNNVQ